MVFRRRGRYASLAMVLLAHLTVCDAALSQPTQPVDIWMNLSQVRTYLEAEADEEGLSGVVLLGRGKEVVYHEAYGLAEVEHAVKMRTDHLLRIGSLTKPITASAVLVAVERGLLSLEDTVCDFLPACPASWRSATVRHLLTHSSGIVDHFGDLESVPVEDTVDELRRVIEALPPDEPLTAPTGTAYAYSNFNYVLLGAVLERATQMSWVQALEVFVFRPLGLETMGYDDVYTIMPGRARGYRRNDDGVLVNIDYDDHAAYAAGGLLASTEDLFRWSRAMLTGQLFSPELVAQSLTPYHGNYGYGWQIRDFFDRRIYNHSGGIDGFSAHLAHYPDYDLTIVVVTNVENDSAILRACDIASTLFAWADEDKLKDANLSPRQRCGLER